MTLNEMIYRRKSFRRYKSEAVDVQTVNRILDFAACAKPLFEEIKVKFEIEEKSNVKSILPFIPKQVLAFYSEDKTGFRENAGFILQQIDLFIQSIGLGCCWIGSGRIIEERARNDGMRYVIMLAFGYPKSDLRSAVSQFRRKKLSEISDNSDTRLEPARLAPSSSNTQPWYFVNEGGIINAYCTKHGFSKNKPMTGINQIDMGIAFAHMYVANPESFRYFKKENPKPVEGYEYIGSFEI